MLESAGLRPTVVRRFAVTYALLFSCLLAWALATPMYGAPDELSHMVRAYAVVHRDGGTKTAGSVIEHLLPSEYTDVTPCYVFRPEQTADCLTLPSPGPDHRVATRAESYPPVYYALVGWPTLFTSRVSGLYMMRAVAAAGVAFLLALALQNPSRCATAISCSSEPRLR